MIFDHFSSAAALSRWIGVDLTRTFLGNSLLDFGLAIGVFVILSVFFKVVQWSVLKRLEKLAQKTSTNIDDTAIEIVRSLRPASYYFLAFFIAFQFLTATAVVSSVVNGVLIIWAVYQVVIAIQILIEHILKKRLVKDNDPGAQAAVAYLKTLSKIALWAMGVLLILSNFGVNITSLVAGLGIGGIAIAFALQNILADLFSSFAIYFDKPFQIGDFIVVGEHMGTVEKIGIKTTRLRALSGEEVTVSNRELTTARVQNFKRMEKRRALFTFGTLYETPTEKVKQIPAFVTQIFKDINGAELDRVHFKSFGDSSLDFEVVYYVLSPEYIDYMDIQQEVNLALKDVFEKENIGFAYPTRTLYLSNYSSSLSSN
jgi:small-conductance mechanosensitive channel